MAVILSKLNQERRFPVTAFPGQLTSLRRRGLPERLYLRCGIRTHTVSRVPSIVRTAQSIHTVISPKERIFIRHRLPPVSEEASICIATYIH